MSDLSDLKQQLDAVAREAKGAAGGMASFKTKFSGHAATIASLIEGSATKVDQSIIDILGQAKTAVEAAETALLTAADHAERYSGGL